MLSMYESELLWHWNEVEKVLLVVRKEEHPYENFLTANYNILRANKL